MMDIEEVFKYLDDCAIVRLEGKNPNMVIKSANKIFLEAVKANDSKNMNDAYIYCKRWQNTVKWLNEKGTDSEKYSINFEEVEKILKKAKEYITIKFETSQNTNNSEIQDLPEIENNEIRFIEKEEITCKELITLLHQSNYQEKLIIIDVRSKEDFLESRISYTECIVNIPADTIFPGEPLDYYNFRLDKEAEKIFSKILFKCVELIVLLDTNSSLDTMKFESPLAIFRRCLKDFSTKTISILKGGFQEWVKMYPDYLTNPLVTQKLPAKSNILKDTSNNINSECIMNNESIRIPSNTTNQNFKPSSMLRNNTINDSSLQNKNEINSSKMYSDITELTLGRFPPHFDRNNKPVLGKKLTNDINNQMRKPKQIDEWVVENLEVKQKSEEERAAELERNGKLYPTLPIIKKQIVKPRPALPPKPNKCIEEKENIVIPQPRLESPINEELPIPQKMDVDDEEIYSIPNKRDHIPKFTTLSKWHSSPNIMKEEKTRPEINRSLKPGRATENENNNKRYNIISSKDRETRMEPVFASSSGHPGITGLKNLGNSCYMNSIIQCLSNTSYLAKYFNDNSYTNDLNKNSNKNTGYVAEEVAQVINALWRGLYKSISPRDLKVVVGQYKLQFESYDQQDSHEFLMFLLDWMHNDLKQESKISYDRPLTIAEKEWNKAMNGQSSIISKLFFGQLRSTITCNSCGKLSMTYETFSSLTMSLPVSNRCTLDECIKKFVSGQEVSGWKCPNCKVPRYGSKKFDIAKLPYIIVIHLNRFGETGGWLEKKNTAVEFPLTKFNLKPYLVQDDDCISNSQSCEYNLYAMSNHYGTMDGGHYTAYCKNVPHNKWYKYDDHTVNVVDQSVIRNQSNSAYLLFYALESAESYLNS